MERGRETGKEIGGGVEELLLGVRGDVESKSEKGLKVAVGETGGEGRGRSLGRDRMTMSSG
jgi:hypothetical protein